MNSDTILASKSQTSSSVLSSGKSSRCLTKKADGDHPPVFAQLHEILSFIYKCIKHELVKGILFFI